MTGCLIDGCVKPAGRPGTARGWCSMHYTRWKRTGNPLTTLTELKPREPAVCQIDGCAKPRWARRMCEMHLMRWRTTGDAGSAARRWIRPVGRCAVEGCKRPMHNGLRRICRAHYLRWIRHGDPLAGAAFRDREARCSVESCPSAFYAKGWCSRHYGQFTGRRRRRDMDRAAPGSASPAAIAARVAFYGGRCWMCGAPYQDIDHVIPLKRGGSNWPANLRPACKPCNSRKQGRDIRVVLAEMAGVA